MIETLVPQIVKALREYEWPETDCSVHFRLLDWTRGGNWYHPLWLAQMVVGIVEEREQWLILATLKDEPGLLVEAQALREFSLTLEDWTWLKEKVGE